LINALPGDPAKREQVDTWTPPTPVEAGFVVDLLTATSRIDVGLAARAIEHLLAWPKTYKLDGVLVPAALAIAKLVEDKAWPAVGRLHEAALDHLRRRIAQPLEARHGIGPGPPHSNALVATAVDWARSWLRRIKSNGA
jgi:hypothetical protein